MTRQALLIAVMLGLGVAGASASPLIRPDPALSRPGGDAWNAARAMDPGQIMRQNDLVHLVAGRRCGRKYFSCIGGRRYRCEVLGRVDAFGRCVPYAQHCSRTGAACR
jgi:hypothetical protein